MENTRAEDPQRIVLSDVLHSWAEDYSIGRGSNVTLAVIIEKCMKTANLGGADEDLKFPELNAAVRAAVTSVGGNSSGSKIDPVKFGIWCRSNKGRIVDGLFLANKPSNRGGAATWWVEKTN
jgi:hypothetical protein